VTTSQLEVKFHFDLGSPLPRYASVRRRVDPIHGQTGLRRLFDPGVLERLVLIAIGVPPAFLEYD
jgi:hypothetical protein